MSRLSERIENFNKAFLLFDEMQNLYIIDKNNNSNRLALIQSFEIIFELGWKVLKDYLQTKYINALTPKDAIKEAFSIDILPNGQVWIDMAKDRNISSHEYNMDKVDLVLEKISTVYFDELQRFHKQIKEFHD